MWDPCGGEGWGFLVYLGDGFSPRRSNGGLIPLFTRVHLLGTPSWAITFSPSLSHTRDQAESIEPATSPQSH